MKRKLGGVIGLVMILVLGGRQNMHGQAAKTQFMKPIAGGPIYEVDPNWPKLEGHFGVNGNWLMGAVGSVAIDPANDHVWLLSRPNSLRADETYALKDPTMADCCVPAPRVLEFDSEGNFIQGWNGSIPDGSPGEHGISIDYKGNVWIAGGDLVLKFTQAGKLLLKIGRVGAVPSSDDPTSLGYGVKAVVYPKTNEVFVGDGYINRRVIVFDADTGAFKRMWGAYGNKPDDEAERIRVFEGPPPRQFFIVHDLAVSNDGLVYVDDRGNNRVQVFKIDGTFVKEVFVDREVRVPSNTVIGVALSTDDRQQYLYVTGADDHIRVLDRNTLQKLTSFSRMGYYPGQLMRCHMIAADSKGNVYLATAGGDGRRPQKFVFKGIAK